MATAAGQPSGQVTYMWRNTLLVLKINLFSTCKRTLKAALQPGAETGNVTVGTGHLCTKKIV